MRKRKSLQGFCVLVAMVYALQVHVVPLMAADTGAQGEAVSIDVDRGERLAGGDQGEVPMAPARDKKPIWPWVLGIAAVGAGAYMAYDGLSSDIDDANKAAEDAAAAAADASEEAAAATAAAASSAASNATASASASEFKYTTYMTGTFTGSDTVYNGTNFTPRISFAVATLSSSGIIADYVKAGTTGWSGLGGSYKQTSDSTVLILVDDSFYMGECGLVDRSTIKLRNGHVLKADANAGVYWLLN